VRFALACARGRVAPLYPWDAWIQWATKSRVWYELGRIAPFARAQTWFAAHGRGVYFDALARISADDAAAPGVVVPAARGAGTTR
jgi:hypothetical protein